MTKRLQISLRLVLFAMGGVAFFLAIFAGERQQERKRREAFHRLEEQFYTYGQTDITWPWHTNWMHNMVGDRRLSLDFVIFSSDAIVDDQTLKDLSLFREIYQLGLSGDISITDAGFDYLRELKCLRSLDLANAPLDAKHVEHFRLTMPKCEIDWSHAETNSHRR